MSALLEFIGGGELCIIGGLVLILAVGGLASGYGASERLDKLDPEIEDLKKRLDKLEDK